MKIIFKLLLPFLLLGCATGQLTDVSFSALPSQANKAVVYIYRPPTAANSLNPDVPMFSVNGQKVGPL